MDRVAIGRELKRLRGAKTIQEVADATGINPSTLGMYEIGERIPRDEIKIILANFYKTTVQDIFYAHDITVIDNDGGVTHE